MDYQRDMNNLLMKPVLLLCLVVLALAADYCEGINAPNKLFLTANEQRRVALDGYLRGHDLDFKVDTPDLAKLYPALIVTDDHPMNLGDYDLLKSVDVRQTPNLAGLGHAALLAEKGTNKDLAIWVGEFLGYDRLPSLDMFRKLTLPMAANCFDLRIVSEAGDSLLNCQTIPATVDDQQWDLFCYITLSETKLEMNRNCYAIPSLFASLSRKSRVLTQSGKRFLLSANNDLNDARQALSYVAVYYLNSMNQVVFNNIIDASDLVQPQLEVSDLLVAPDGTIVIADSGVSRLLFFSYEASNVVTLKLVKPLASRPYSLAFSSQRSTLLVATKEGITEHLASSPDTIVNRYEVDPSDGLIVSLQASEKLLAFTTRNRNLYVYQRTEHKLNYLLQKQEIASDTTLVLSQDQSFLFTFNAAKSQSVAVTSPYLQIGNLQKNAVIKVSATSGTEVCEVELSLNFVADLDAIVSKASLEDRSFKVDPQNGLKVRLDDFYGGVNLKYDLPKSGLQGDFDVVLEHISNFPFTPTFAKTETTTLLALDSKSFYYIGVNSIKESMFYADLCTLADQKVTCISSIQVKTISNTKKTIEAITTATRTDGTSICLWSYKNSGVAEWVYMMKGGRVGFSSRGASFAYSSLHIDEDKFVLVSKTARIISILYEKNPFYLEINDQYFTDGQLDELQHFYPREVILEGGIFFVKLLSKVAKFAFLPNHKVQYIGIAKTLKEFVPDNQWKIVKGSGAVIQIVSNSITEEYYNPSQAEYVTLQSVDIPTHPAWAKFDDSSRLLAVVSTAGNGPKHVKIIKTGRGSMDFQYAEMDITGEPTLSGNWLLSDEAKPSIYFVSSDPTLSVRTNLPEDTFKEDLSVNIEVKSKGQTEMGKTEIEAVNFPVNIRNIPEQSIVKAPLVANHVEITLPVENYFNGSVADYFLECPFCGGKRIHLYPPLREEKRVDNEGLLDFVTIDTRTIAVKDNVLILMNDQAEIITHAGLPRSGCSNLAYDEASGLFVFCSGESGQEIFIYDINKDHFFFSDSFVLHGQSAIRSFDSMEAITIVDQHFLMILDNDETIDSNSKKSFIKLFGVTDDLEFLGEWDSRTFGIQELLPINDFYLEENRIVVTIGNYGLGYGIFQGKTALANEGNLKLSSLPDIKDILLDDSYFKEVSVVSIAGTSVELFVSSTTSLSMILSLKLNDQHLEYVGLKESYFRYGGMRLLNWHTVTATNVYLSFYNESISEATIVSYPRNTKGRTQFNIGVSVPLAPSRSRYHEAFVLGKRLLTSHLHEDESSDELVVYSIEDHFTLALNYDVAGDFNTITILAINSYNEARHEQHIEFAKPIPPPPPTPDDKDDGLKWYVVVIVSAVVLIIVGTSYGLFRYMKKKRSEKSVSLLTEKEEDEDEDEKETTPNQRDSINA